MMWLHKLNTWLIASDDEAIKEINKLEEGEAIKVKIVRVRSIPWHRWYFACCHEIGMHQEPERSESTIDYALRFWSGHVEEIRDSRGRVMEVAKRIAFEKLDANEWALLWLSLEKTMIDKFGFDPVEFKDKGNGWA